MNKKMLKTIITCSVLTAGLYAVYKLGQIDGVNTFVTNLIDISESGGENPCCSIGKYGDLIFEIKAECIGD